MLFSVHTMGAMFLNIAELQITDDEAKALAAAITNVTEQYDVQIVDPKTMAWINLAMVGGGIYGTRVASLMLSGKQKKGAPGNVAQMPRVVNQQ